jgi:acyl-CoA thioester hydrolase
LTSLERLYEGKVGAEEIDDLGHMNVRYYGERALDATDRLLGAHGLDPRTCESMNASLEVNDIYTRHLREQMAGAPLAVMGGVLEAHADGVRLYHELSNTENSDLAATFVHCVRLRSRDDLSTLALPEMAAKSLREAIVSWPEHGRPRSIDLDRQAFPLSLSDARERGLALRKERFVLEDECGSSGSVPAGRRQDLVWGGEPIAPHSGGPPIFDLEDGSRMSMAALETRSQLIEAPRLGMRIQSFSATVDVAKKTTIRRAWVFDVVRERLLFSNTFVDIALHLGKRRSMEIPPEMRARLEASAHADLR